MKLKIGDRVRDDERNKGTVMGLSKPSGSVVRVKWDKGTEGWIGREHLTKLKKRCLRTHDRVKIIKGECKGEYGYVKGCFTTSSEETTTYSINIEGNIPYLTLELTRDKLKYIKPKKEPTQLEKIEKWMTNKHPQGGTDSAIFKVIVAHIDEYLTYINKEK
jgi:hypothetical protein